MDEHLIICAALTIAVGIPCGLIAKRLRVPAGFMRGAFFGVSVLSIATGEAWLPTETRTLVQMVAGAFVGCSLERSDLVRLRGFLKPMVLLLAIFLLLNLVVGFLIWATSPLSLVTSLMCAVPGGINDTPIVAAAMGANAPDVTIMQLIRQVLGIGVFPIMIEAFDRLRTRQGHPDPGDAALGEDAKRVKSKQKSAASTATALAVAVIAGALGKASGIPGLTFTASIVAVSVLKLAFDFAFIPKVV